MAEEEGRLPRSRAAARLGLSQKAFDAGCRAVGYVATEWHHVGRYAIRVRYYDTNFLAEDPAFWVGAATAYKAAKKRAEVADTLRRRKIEAFRKKLIAQRDCSRLVVRANTSANWHRYVFRLGQSAASEQVKAVASAVIDRLKTSGVSRSGVGYSSYLLDVESLVAVHPHLCDSNREFFEKTGFKGSTHERRQVVEFIGEEIHRRKGKD
jgi:hypothetical protein